MTEYLNWAAIDVHPGGSFVVQEQARLSHSLGTITNDGLTRIDGHVQIRLNGGTTLANNGQLDINGTITNESYVENSGDITIGRVDLGAGMLNNQRYFTTTGGTVEVLAGAYFVSSGGIIASDGASVTNRNLVSIEGGLADFKSGAAFHNHAEFRSGEDDVFMALEGGTFYNHCGGTVLAASVWGNLVHLCETAPTVTSATASDVGGDRARLGADVTASGGAPLAVRGFVVAPTALDADPALGNPHATTFDSSSATTGVYAVWATGLQPGRAYSFKAYATTEAGVTAYSTVATFTTLATPAAPTIGTAEAGDGHASITFTPPGDHGAAPIMHYTAISEPDGRTSEPCPYSPCHVLGLDNGTSYRFRVVAVSSIGTSPPSELSNAVTPAGGNGAPTLGAVAAQSFLEGDSVTVHFTVADDTTPAADVVVSATSSNGELFGDGALAAGLGGSGGARTLLLQPHPDAHGATQITLQAMDADGAWSTRVFFVDVININDAPRLALGADPSHPSGVVGPMTLPWFAVADGGPGEQGEAIAYRSAIVDDPNGVVASVDIDALGTVSYVLTGNDGVATVRIDAQDGGGTAHGGHDSTSATFRILVGGTAGGDITLSVVRVPEWPGGAARTYDVLVTNYSDTARDALALDVSARRLTGLQWTCAADTDACSPMQVPVRRAHAWTSPRARAPPWSCAARPQRRRISSR